MDCDFKEHRAKINVNNLLALRPVLVPSDSEGAPTMINVGAAPLWVCGPSCARRRTSVAAPLRLVMVSGHLSALEDARLMRRFNFRVLFAAQHITFF